MACFPMMVSLENKNVLVVGAGEEGTKKVEVLCQFGAAVTLIAVSATQRAVELAGTFISRRFADEDLADGSYVLVVAATDDPKTNERISFLARERKIPVNVVDNPALCTFIFPAIVKEGDVVCAVSSGGKSPYVAQYVKGLIQKALPADIGRINDRMGDYRIRAKKEIADKQKRRAFLRQKLDELLR